MAEWERYGLLGFTINLQGGSLEDYHEGFQSVPVDWGISSEREKNFFNKLKEITGY